MKTSDLERCRALLDAQNVPLKDRWVYFPESISNRREGKMKTTKRQIQVLFKQKKTAIRTLIHDVARGEIALLVPEFRKIHKEVCELQRLVKF